MVFGSKWVRWISWCVSTARFFALVNGKLVGFFPSSRDLRQGDPLSPYLFVMGIEVLRILLKRAMKGGFILGCTFRRRGGEELSISHLLFADDTIAFCGALEDQLLYLS